MGKIDDSRADKSNRKTENIKLNVYKEFHPHWDKILEVKLKSLEFIETEIDNCTQNMHNVAAASIVGLASLSIYLFNNLTNIVTIQPYPNSLNALNFFIRYHNKLPLMQLSEMEQMAFH